MGEKKSIECLLSYVSFYLLSFAQRIWPAVEVLACAVSVASWRRTAGLAGDSLSCHLPHAGVFRGPEELVLGRCAPFGRKGVVTGTGALDSGSYKTLKPGPCFWGASWVLGL